MAGKKPAKVNSSNKKEVVVLPGKAIKYMGTPGKEYVCPTCSRSLVKGILYEDGSVMYCRRVCIPKPEVVAV